MSKFSKLALGLSMVAVASLYVFDPGKVFAQRWGSGSTWAVECWITTDTRGNQVTTCGNGGTFGSETREPITPAPTLALVKSKAREVNVFEADIASETYLKLAKNLGLSSAPIDESRLKMAIHGHGFKIYDFKSVDEYLYTMALKQGANYRWVWKPMREKDSNVLTASNRRDSENGNVSNTLYAHAIPERILEDVSCLLDEVPELVALVSDYEVRRPDPFLAVTTPKMWEQGKVLVIDVWAEPGFKESTSIQGPVQPVAAQKLASR